jgi:hypothetical protein
MPLFIGSIGDYGDSLAGRGIAPLLATTLNGLVIASESEAPPNENSQQYYVMDH